MGWDVPDVRQSLPLVSRNNNFYLAYFLDLHFAILYEDYQLQSYDYPDQREHHEDELAPDDVLTLIMAFFHHHNNDHHVIVQQVESLEYWKTKI